jgi:hypothetical protein
MAAEIDIISNENESSFDIRHKERAHHRNAVQTPPCHHLLASFSASNR